MIKFWHLNFLIILEKCRVIHDPAILKFRITDFATIIFQKMQKRWQSFFLVCPILFAWTIIFITPRFLYQN